MIKKLLRKLFNKNAPKPKQKIEIGDVIKVKNPKQSFLAEINKKGLEYRVLEQQLLITPDSFLTYQGEKDGNVYFIVARNVKGRKLVSEAQTGDLVRFSAVGFPFLEIKKL